ncbi:MAG: hypothetical protein FWB71_01410 [Defluviitaleaceae bacterium]|nr:hypothetical protein [Defluviitaleaceae bacterium]
MLPTSRYIDEAYFIANSRGDFPSGEIPLAIARAQDLIDHLTHNQAHAGWDTALTPFQREKIRLACVYTADHLLTQAAAGFFDLQSYTVSGMRIDLTRRKAKPWEIAGCGHDAWIILNQTNLL